MNELRNMTGIAPCKGIQDSLGFWGSTQWIPDPGVTLNSGLLIFCQWNLDSEFQSLVGFRIPWAVFLVAQQAKISLIPESEFPYTDIRLQEISAQRF